MKKLIAILFIVCLTGCFEQKAKIIDSSSYYVDGKYFGFSVSISGDHAIIGNPENYNVYGFKTGMAYIVERDSSGNWGHPNRIAPSNMDTGDFLGYSVSICNDVAIISANHEDDYRGAAYIYQNSAGSYFPNIWYEVKRIIASDRASGDYFGSSTDINDDYAIVGASQDNSKRGAVYIYLSDSGWAQTQKLVAPDNAINDYFGSAVAISDNYMAVGSPYDDNAKGTNAGAVYIYKKYGSTWYYVKKLIAPDGASYDLFGWAVDLTDEFVIVGAPYEDNENGNNAGSVYVFTINNYGYKEKLITENGYAGDQFGRSLSISGEVIIIGAPYDDESGGNAGAAYIYGNLVVNDDDGTYVPVEKLFASDAATYDLFGFSVALADDYAIVGSIYDDNANGSNAGSAYIFEKEED